MAASAAYVPAVGESPDDESFKKLQETADE